MPWRTQYGRRLREPLSGLPWSKKVSRLAHFCSGSEWLAAVAIAMTFAAMENFNFLLRDVSHVEPLLRDAAIRSLLSTPSAAADSFVVGIWAAVGIAEKGRVVVARVLTGLAFAILAHGVWDASAFLAAPFFPTGDASSWSAAPAWTFVAGGMLASISIDTLGLVIGMQRLALSGVRFRLPYRF